MDLPPASIHPQASDLNGSSSRDQAQGSSNTLATALPHDLRSTPELGPQFTSVDNPTARHSQASNGESENVAPQLPYSSSQSLVDSNPAIDRVCSSKDSDGKQPSVLQPLPAASQSADSVDTDDLFPTPKRRAGSAPRRPLRQESNSTPNKDELEDEVSGWLDSVVAYIRKQSVTKAWPSRLGDISRMQLAALFIFSCVWIYNQAQLAVIVSNDFRTNGPPWVRSWFKKQARLFDDVFLTVIYTGYIKEAIRLLLWIYMLFSSKIGSITKWIYAFVSCSALMLPIVCMSKRHSRIIVRCKAFDAVFEPQVVLWDLVTIDFPLAARAALAFTMGTNNFGAFVSSLWTTLSVASKFSRFSWRVLLGLQRHQLIQRAHARRGNTIHEWSRGIQDMVGLVGSERAIDEIMTQVPKAAKVLGAPDATSRLYSDFRPAMTNVLEMLTLAGFISLWRMLRSPWSAGSGFGSVLGSSRELREAAKLVRRGGVSVADALEGMIRPSKNHRASEAFSATTGSSALSRHGAMRVLLSSVRPGSSGSGGGGSRRYPSIDELRDAGVSKKGQRDRGKSVSNTNKNEADVTSAEQELADVIMRHAETLSYLERTHIPHILVTDDVVATIKDLWSTRAMQLLMAKLTESPSLWQDRVMGMWPREVMRHPYLRDAMAMLPFRIKLVSYCVERCERFLRRTRPKISDINQLPHSLSELVLAEAFCSPVVRFVSRKNSAFGLYRVPCQVQNQWHKLLVMSDLFVVCAHLADFTKIMTGTNGQPTTKFLTTLSDLEELLPPRERNRRVVICCLGLAEFQNSISYLDSEKLKTHYPNLFRKWSRLSEAKQWPYFKDYLQRLLTNLVPDYSKPIMTDERGLERCIVELLMELDERTTQELLNNANLY